MAGNPASPPVSEAAMDELLEVLAEELVDRYLTELEDGRPEQGEEGAQR